MVADAQAQGEQPPALKGEVLRWPHSTKSWIAVNARGELRYFRTAASKAGPASTEWGRLPWSGSNAGARSSDEEACRRLAAEVVALRERVDELTAWQDAVTAEVAAHPGLPCSREEVTLDYVPALVAVLAGRIEHADDYSGPPATTTSEGGE